MARLHVDMNSAEVTQRIERDLSDAKSLTVTATPEYFVNGKPMPSFGEQQLRVSWRRRWARRISAKATESPQAGPGVHGAE
jgi:hypothetical protein